MISHAAFKQVADEVFGEIVRSQARFGEYSTSGRALTDQQRYLVLSEEVGEVAEALVMHMADGRFAGGREGHADDIYRELVQVAAVAIGWLISAEFRRTP